MNKVIVIFAIVFAVFVGVVVYQFTAGMGQSPQPTPNVTVTINKQIFKATVVKESLDQQIGLSKYTSLPEDQGMLFEFTEPGYYPFWMKDMKFAIDIIFIDGDKIVSIAQDVPAPKSPDENLPQYQPEAPANKVFEIKAGLAKKYNIKKGDTVEIKQ